MSPLRLARLSLMLAAIGLNVAPVLIGSAYAQKAGAPAAAGEPAKADTVRPELFKLLDPALVKELMAAKKYPEVQAKIAEADAFPNKTPYEIYVLDRMRLALTSATNDTPGVTKALEAVIASGRLPANDQIDFIMALASSYFNAKNYPKAIEWFERYQKDGGDPAKARQYLVRSYYLNNDYAKAKQELTAQLQANEKTGTPLPMEDLQLLASSAAKLKDTPTYLVAMEKLVMHYPSDDFWGDLLNRTQNKPTYSNRLQLDVHRLEQLAIKTLMADSYVDSAELSLLAGLPTEAKKTVDAGYAAGVLGKGAGAAKHKKLRDQANKGAADDVKTIAQGEAKAIGSKDGLALVNLGYAYVTMDQFDKGLDLMQKGIAKGSLKKPEDATLHLGVAYALAGRKADALKTFETVKGGDGLNDLARYWTMYLNRPAAK